MEDGKRMTGNAGLGAITVSGARCLMSWAQLGIWDWNVRDAAHKMASVLLLFDTDIIFLLLLFPSQSSNIPDYSCTGAVQLTSKVKTHNVWRHGVWLRLKRLWRLEVADLGSELTPHAATYITVCGSQIVPLTQIMCTCSNKSCRQDMHRCGPSLCVSGCTKVLFQVKII